MKKNQEQPISEQRVQPVTDLDEKIQLDRKEAYIDPKTRELLRTLLQNDEKMEVIPVYKPGVGYIYQTNQNNVPIDFESLTKSALENLTNLGILQKSFYDTVSVCPNCSSTVLTMHGRCPECKSHDVEKTSLTEHITCGNIDQRSKYVKDICPKCGELLIEGQFRNMGRWYVCHKCGNKFENPELDIICRNCKKTFSTKEANISELPKFTLNTSRKKEIRQNVVSLENIRNILIDLGFRVEIPGLMIGQKSGMEHHFSLIAKRQIDDQEILIALDHAVSETEVQTSPIILYIYKTSEVHVDIPVFVAMPKLNEAAGKIAQGHNILTIEGQTDEPQDEECIKGEIEARINELVSKNQKEAEIKKAEDKTETKPESKSVFGKFLRKK